MTIWVAIVTVLMLATVFLLQWNRISFRTPLDILAESREARYVGRFNLQSTVCNRHFLKGLM